ncbi:SDR family NAD(P)-dependent oxidoreductase, partial [Paraburkholderia sp. SIMBA_049]
TPRDDVLPPSEHLRVLALDVTNPDSIRAAIDAAGPIDVLVNNAGFGAAAPAELMPLDTVRALFETNTIGTIAVTEAVLPQLRR